MRITVTKQDKTGKKERTARKKKDKTHTLCVCVGELGSNRTTNKQLEE